MKKFILVAWIGAMLVGGGAIAAELKIGFVNTERLFREAGPAIKAQKRIEQDFAKRELELQKSAKQLKDIQDGMEKNSITMNESERRTKDREFTELNKEFQRKQREFREDLNQRRNEEYAAVLEKANKIIRQIAEAEKFDLIFEQAVYASSRIDITEKVIKALVDK